MKKPLQIGDRASISKVFTSDDLAQFAGLSEDRNPIHLDDAVAAESVFGQRVVHGMLVSSLFSGLLGMDVPGEGSIYLGQELKFKAPVFIDQRVTATVEVVDIRQDKSIARLKTRCVTDEGTVVIEGEAVVKFT